MLGQITRQEIPLFIGYMATGCCSNVYTFERLIKINAKTTTLITFSQYLFIFIFSLIYLLYNRYWLGNNAKNPAKIYLPEYFIPVLLQTLTAHLSNYVFQWGFTLPTHIIIRSLSTTITMILGSLFWKKSYNWKKVTGSCLVVIGTILFTLDLKNVKSGCIKINVGDNVLGIIILLIADVINCLVNLYKEDVYQDESNSLEWKSAMFYYNLYALMFYIPFSYSIRREYYSLRQSMVGHKDLFGVFIWNLITQLSCIIGVNILVFQISALSLTIVLLIRRFISLFLSIYIFNASIDIVGYCSIVIVIIGTLVYALNDLEWRVRAKDEKTLEV